MWLVKWSDKLSVGVSVIDAEHKELATLFNDLASVVLAGQDKDSIRKALDALIDHTAAHFKHEEALFAETNYPHAAEHKKEHDDLIWQITAIQEAYRDDHIAISVDTLQFTRKWLLNHIQTCDKKFGLHMNPKKVNGVEERARASIMSRPHTFGSRGFA